MIVPSKKSLDLGFGAEILLELTHFLLQHLLRNLGFDFIKFRQLRFAHIVQTDHMPAKLGFHWLFGQLALFQSCHGF